MAAKNLVSAEIPATDLAEIKTCFGTIRSKLKFLISLTEEERKGGMKLGDRTLPFVEKTVDYSVTHPQFVANFIDINEWKKDYKLYKDLTGILSELRPLFQDIVDTASEVGIEALSPSLTYYGLAQEGAKKNVPGAKEIANDLGLRFPARAKKKV
jgi:hypothetical protein